MIIDNIVLNVGYETTDVEKKSIQKCFSDEFYSVEIVPNIFRRSHEPLAIVIEFVIPAIVSGIFYDSFKSSLINLRKVFQSGSLRRGASITIRKGYKSYVISETEMFQLIPLIRKQIETIDELIEILRTDLPKLIIFAGANGSGKTTVARALLPKLKIKEFVNADEIARGLSPFNPTAQAMAAGRLVSKRIDELTA